MNRKRIFGMLAIFIVVASIATVSAFQGKFSGMDAAGRGEIFDAIKAKDFSAWKEAASKSPMISKIDNEDDFKILVQLHQAKKDGDYTKVKELSEQLGLPGVSGKNKMSEHFVRGRMI